MDIEIGGKTLPLGNLLVIIGGLLMFISMFLSVFTLEATIFGTHISDTSSGIQVFLAEDSSFAVNAPVIAGIFGIIVAIIAALPLFTDLGDKKKTLNILAAVLSLVALILLFWFIAASGSVFNTSDAEALEYIEMGIIKPKVEFGIYISIIGSILALVGSALSVKNSN